MRRLALLATLAALISGCGNDKGFKPNATIDEVSPTFVAQGRTKDVTIRGAFTDWRDVTLTPADVSFGAGVTVNTVTIANEENLLVNITAEPGAAEGVRDVTIGNEVYASSFKVVAPFVLSATSVKQGQYVLIEAIGFDTDWLDGATQLSISGDGVFTDGSDALFGATGVEVLREDYLQALIKVSPFAAAGPRDVAINGIIYDDVLPAKLAIDTVDQTVLGATGNESGDLSEPFAVKTFSITAGIVGDLQTIGFTPNGATEPFGLLYEPGAHQPVRVLDDPAEQLSELVFEPASKDLVIVFQEYSLAGGEGLGFVLEYVKSNVMPVATVDGTALAAQTIDADGINYFHHLGTKWKLASIDLSTIGATFNPRLNLIRNGRYSPITVNAGGAGVAETLPFLSGVKSGMFSTVTDVNGATGAGTEFDFVWSQADVNANGVIHDGTGGSVPDGGFGSCSAPITTEITVVQGNPITRINALLDIEHTYRGDVIAELVSPSGTSVLLADQTGGSSEGLLHAYGDPITPGFRSPDVGSMDDFIGETPVGTWRLRVQDCFTGDTGTLNGWAIVVE